MALELEGAEGEVPVVEQHCAQISLEPEQAHHFLVVAEPQLDEIQKDLGAVQLVAVAAELVVGVADLGTDCRGRSVDYKTVN